MFASSEELFIHAFDSDQLLSDLMHGQVDPSKSPLPQHLTNAVEVRGGLDIGIASHFDEFDNSPFFFGARTHMRRGRLRDVRVSVHLRGGLCPEDGLGRGLLGHWVLQKHRVQRWLTLMIVGLSFETCYSKGVGDYNDRGRDNFIARLLNLDASVLLDRVLT